MLFIFFRYSCIESFDYVYYHQLWSTASRKKRFINFIMTFAHFGLETRIRNISWLPLYKLIVLLSFVFKKSIKTLFSNIAPSLKEKCKEGKTILTVSKFLPQNCVFYRTEIQGTVWKQPIRIEYLIKQNI